MRLTSEDGAQLTLTIRGYEFPDLGDAKANDWDTNWLVVSGELILVDGRRHSFAAPCMTTWEARELQDWLLVLSKRLTLEPSKGPTLVFTEPCVAFSALPAGGDKIEVRAYLSHEAEPPFVVAGAAGTFEDYVPLCVDPAALGVAAAEWVDDLCPFPKR